VSVKINRALISVSNKIGIVKLAQVLQSQSIEIISTGGTYRQLAEAGINVMKVEELTGFPEMLDGRVKTLHPFIHGAILADRSKEDHMNQISDKGIRLIDMVVVNLYPFKETIAKKDVTFEKAIENIDIGGPTMIRSAAKNNSSVAVVVDPEDYEKISEELTDSGGSLSETTLFSLSVKAFQHTCEYDSVIFDYLIKRYDRLKETDYRDSRIYIKPYLKIDSPEFDNETPGGEKLNVFRNDSGDFIDDLDLSYEKKQDLRYGENPHQKAAFYKLKNADFESFANSQQLQGKELSYNNILDTNAAFAIVKEFERPCVAVIKHNNPCGVAVATTVAEAYRNAHLCDPVSAFGSIVASNYKWTSDAARFMMDKFVEVLIAPDFEDEALKILKSRENLRVMKINFSLSEYLSSFKSNKREKAIDIKSVDGGLLVQDLDEIIAGSESFENVTDPKPTRSQIDDLIFSWQVAKNVKSNAIVLANKGTTTGIGAGQMSRVDAAKIAIEKAGEKIKGSVLASDAFFPFSDAVELAADAGIAAIIQPGGSKRDREVIDFCNKRGIPMLFTGKRHFRH
jgi:phosphoribosylaminoimidazolecarboxamide formyltransferase/IMP cyclohydrolase